MQKPNSEHFQYDHRKMTLIIKPTEACNFSCNFCSSSNLVSDKKVSLEAEKIFLFLKRFPNTSVIFVVGGDPLMMPPSYYQKIINFIEENKLKTKISMTTNLWDFYKHPEKWFSLFSHPLIEIGTSFQYGEGRQITPGVVFTEEIFIKVFNKFKQYFPEKDLCFLAVIDKDNEHLALDHVYLAKRLNIQCRLVYASKSGRSNQVYPLSKLYKIFIQIWKLGLTQYEQTALTISEKIHGIEVSCPLSRNCDQWMRSLNPDGRYFSCGPLNDDLDTRNEIDFNTEVVKAENYFLPLKNNFELQYLKDECLSCKMFEVCNACRKHIKDLKETNMVEEHCSVMKEISSDLIQMSNSIPNLFVNQ